jgi:hypothetical protein
MKKYIHPYIYKKNIILKNGILNKNNITLLLKNSNIILKKIKIKI